MRVQGGEGPKDKFLQNSTELLEAGTKRWNEDLQDPAVLNTNMVHWEVDAPPPTPYFQFASLVEIFGEKGAVAYGRQNCSA